MLQTGYNVIEYCERREKTMKIKQELVLFAAILLLFGNTSCIPLVNNFKAESSETLGHTTYPIEDPSMDQKTNDYLLDPTQQVLENDQDSSIPTPENGTSVLSGQMLTPGIGGKPYVGDLYLANLLHPNESNQPPLIKFSEAQNPKAKVNSEGLFFFTDIEPGEYALIVYSLGGTYIISDSDGQTMFITVEADSVVDLGIIEIP